MQKTTDAYGLMKGFQQYLKRTPVVKATDENCAKIVSSNEFVVIEFWSESCPICMRIVPIMQEIANEYKGELLVAEMNVEENEQVPTDLGINAVPTFITFRQGEELERMVGAPPRFRREIYAMLDGLKAF